MSCPAQVGRQGVHKVVQQYTLLCKLVSLQQYGDAREQSRALYTTICSSWGIQTSGKQPSTKQHQRNNTDRVLAELPQPADNEDRKVVAVVLGTVSNLLLCTIQCLEAGRALEVLQDCAVLYNGLQPWIRYRIQYKCDAFLHHIFLIFPCFLVDVHSADRVTGSVYRLLSPSEQSKHQGVLFRYLYKVSLVCLSYHVASIPVQYNANRMVPAQGAMLIFEDQSELKVGRKWGMDAEEVCKSAVAACIKSSTLPKASQVSWR